MSKYYPKSFWISIGIFLVFQWSALLLTKQLATRSIDLVWATIIVVGIFYPIYYVATIFYLKNKGLAGEQLLVAGLILLLPPLTVIPLLA